MKPIASECVDTRLRGDRPGIMCKLDIEKAYGHVNLDFFLNTLQQMGFGERQLKWMGACIKTVRFSVLVNGEPAVCSPQREAQREAQTGRSPISLLFCFSHGRIQ